MSTIIIIVDLCMPIVNLSKLIYIYIVRTNTALFVYIYSEVCDSPAKSNYHVQNISEMSVYLVSAIL